MHSISIEFRIHDNIYLYIQNKVMKDITSFQVFCATAVATLPLGNDILSGT
jgi:hypothetical protein